MSKIEYKYRLHYLLRRLTVNDYEIAMKQLPRLVGRSERTFREWIYLPLDATYDMPFCVQLKLAKYFKISPIEMLHEELQNKILQDHDFEN